MSTILASASVSPPVSTLAVLSWILGVCALLAMSAWMWAFLLDRSDFVAGRVRMWMALLLLIATIVETGYCVVGLIPRWVLCTVFVANAWGAADAISRYPAECDVESFFAMKLMLLGVMKTLAYAAAGFRDLPLQTSVGMFFAVLVFHIWGLPLFYLMAMPTDCAGNYTTVESSGGAESDVAIRTLKVMLRLVVNPSFRQRCFNTGRRFCHRTYYALLPRCCCSVPVIACGGATAEFRRKFAAVAQCV